MPKSINTGHHTLCESLLQINPDLARRRGVQQVALKLFGECVDNPRLHYCIVLNPGATIRESSSVRLAKLAVDKVLAAPCGTSILYPKSGGNVHCFTAIAPSAVLDVLTPPYRENAGRRCTYYRDYPYSTFYAACGAELVDGKDEDYSWLAEITPSDLYMRPGKYAGPPIKL